VIGYHRVVDEIVDDGPLSPSLCISTDSFRRQMEQVQRQFQVLTWSMRWPRSTAVSPSSATPAPSLSMTAIATSIRARGRSWRR